MFSIIAQQSEYIEIGDTAQIGPYPATVTGWRKQPAWCTHTWNIRLWVPALNRTLWVPLHDLVLS